MREVFTFSGQEPKFEKSTVDQAEILRLFHRQLDIIESMAATHVLIPAGTQLCKEDLKP